MPRPLAPRISVVSVNESVPKAKHPGRRLEIKLIVAGCTVAAIALGLKGFARLQAEQGKPIVRAVARDKDAGLLPGLHPGEHSSFSFTTIRFGRDAEADAIRSLAPEVATNAGELAHPKVVTVTFEVLDGPEGATIRKLSYFYELRPGYAALWLRTGPVIISEPPEWRPRRLEVAAGTGTN